MDVALTFRPARSDDRPAMERICAQTWAWGDYIPEVWQEWLTSEDGALIAAEMGDRVVALSRITYLPHGQVWLEGMRVDPEVRRTGIAGHFLAYSLALARERGARVVRLGTGDYNSAVHRMATRAGMEHVGTYTFWTAEPEDRGPIPAILSPEFAGQLQTLRQDSPVLVHSHGLFCLNWAWEELDAERVIAGLKAKQFVADLATSGEITALALVSHEPDSQRMWIGFADGQPAAVTKLAASIRTYAASLGSKELSIALPDVPWLQEAFASAGYGLGDWEGGLWIYERWLNEGEDDPHDR